MDIEKQFSEKALADFRLIDAANEKRDQKAFSQLMKRYKKSVYHIILKMVRNHDTAEDLTMEVFAKAFKNLYKFKKDFSFSTWLFRIASNHTIDYLRKKRLQTVSLTSSFVDDAGDPVTLEVADENLNPQERTINAEKIKIMRKVVDDLPAKYQNLVELRYFDELSYEEISKKLNAPLGTVKAQLHRSRELLFNVIESSREASSRIIASTS